SASMSTMFFLAGVDALRLGGVLDLLGGGALLEADDDLDLAGGDERRLLALDRFDHAGDVDAGGAGGGAGLRVGEVLVGRLEGALLELLGDALGRDDVRQ